MREPHNTMVQFNPPLSSPHPLQVNWTVVNTPSMTTTTGIQASRHKPPYLDDKLPQGIQGQGVDDTNMHDIGDEMPNIVFADTVTQPLAMVVLEMVKRLKSIGVGMF
jgi:hypothetical protein